MNRLFSASVSVSVIPYTNDEQAEAATKNSHLKLMFRLVKFLVLDEGEYNPIHPVTVHCSPVQYQYGIGIITPRVCVRISFFPGPFLAVSRLRPALA